ncbi:hypothetical protein NDU88_002526 [Pleurodeles waltl]|uniref:Uncharacterized protein n=1 Tax=Pleurodeles waltl TaxID=8319 RepID=A0AAV7MW15_PLEWA|nr:hypothetical protein NDU88_002526 [Pleurodeles waltl]
MCRVLHRAGDGRHQQASTPGPGPSVQGARSRRGPGLVRARQGGRPGESHPGKLFREPAPVRSSCPPTSSASLLRPPSQGAAGPGRGALGSHLRRGRPQAPLLECPGVPAPATRKSPGGPDPTYFDTGHVAAPHSLVSWHGISSRNPREPSMLPPDWGGRDSLLVSQRQWAQKGPG